MPKVVAQKEIYYARQTYQPGDEVEVSEKDAKVLIAIGKVRATAPKPAEAKDADVTPAEETPSVPLSQPGTYLRRDLTAEDGRTGGERSPSSSRRGRRRNTPTSDD